MASLTQLGPALLLALQPAAAEPAVPSLHAAAFSALIRCAESRSQQTCQLADSELKALIRDQERAEQRELQPRCLGALTQLESLLAAYRWRLETTDNLRLAINAANQQCPAPSAGLSQ